MSGANSESLISLIFEQLHLDSGECCTSPVGHCLPVHPVNHIYETCL